jgi:DNA-binding CsgD family transcriptional regulator
MPFVAASPYGAISRRELPVPWRYSATLPLGSPTPHRSSRRPSPSHRGSVKGAEQEELGRAVRAVAAGEAIFGPAVAQRMLRFFTPAPVADPFPQLTGREREVLGLLAAALSNATIASRLGLSPKTVANHISSIFNKLQVADRAQAILRARDAGLGTGDG